MEAKSTLPRAEAQRACIISRLRSQLTPHPGTARRVLGREVAQIMLLVFFMVGALPAWFRKTENSALCITGQLRSVPLAHQNWVSGPVYRLLSGPSSLLSSGNSIDTYVVTSQSNSFSVWTDWMNKTLRPQSVLATSVGFDMLDVPAEQWTHRLNGTRLQFNLRHMRGVHGLKKLDAQLVQLAHAWHCVSLVEEGEQKLQKRYATIVRIRSDVVVGAQLWPTRLQPWDTASAAAPKVPKGPPVRCRAAADATRTDFLAMEDASVDRCVAQSSKRGSWLIHAEWFDAGTRGEMLHLLRGIDELTSSAHHHNNSLPLHAIGWRVALKKTGLGQEATRCVHTASTLGSCAEAFCDFDFIRAVGPPTGAYFFQETEWQCAGAGTCSSKPPEVCPRECVDAACKSWMNSRWRIQQMQPFGLSYKPKDELVRMSERLVGDFKYNKLSYAKDDSYDGFSTGGTVRASVSLSSPLPADVQANGGSLGYLKGAVPRLWREIPPLVCRDELASLANKLGLTGFAAEIGVYRGDFARKNLGRWKGQHYWMIDAWEQRANDTKKSNEKSDNNDDTARQLNRHERAKANTEPWKSRRTMLRAYSVPAASRFPDHHFDWIYVDALHTHDAVLEDLKAWWPKLKMGGMISGDDYADKGDQGFGDTDAPTIFSWGVRSAVNAFGHGVQEQVYTSAGNNFFVKTTEGKVARRGCHDFQAWYMFKTH